MLKPVLVGCLFACSLSLASGCSDPDPDAPPPVAPEPARPPPTVDEDPNLEALDLSGTRVHEALIETLLELNPNSDIPYSRMGALALRELEFEQLLRPFDFTTSLPPGGHRGRRPQRAGPRARRRRDPAPGLLSCRERAVSGACLERERLAKAA